MSSWVKAAVASSIGFVVQGLILFIHEVMIQTHFRLLSSVYKR